MLWRKCNVDFKQLIINRVWSSHTFFITLSLVPFFNSKCTVILKWKFVSLKEELLFLYSIRLIRVTYTLLTILFNTGNYSVFSAIICVMTFAELCHLPVCLGIYVIHWNSVQIHCSEFVFKTLVLYWCKV